MIPRASITAWRSHAPWSLDTQVEQDLVLSRALVEIFTDPLLRRSLAFRGGTALHKLYFDPPGRYSEDIDLVQVAAGPAGELMTALRARLDPWLGKPRFKQGEGRITFYYRFISESLPATAMRLKVEINTREHFSVLEPVQKTVAVDTPWFTGGADVTTYALEELLGTKLRALYQRKKGRDVFDLARCFAQHPTLDVAQLLTCFQRYMDHGGTPVSRAQFEANLHAKRTDPDFLADITPLLAAGSEVFDPVSALEQILSQVVAGLPGEPWKGKTR